MDREESGGRGHSPVKYDGFLDTRRSPRIGSDLSSNRHYNATLED